MIWKLTLPFIATVLFSSAVAQAQQWEGILNPSRGIDWSGAGISGGIPSRTTICNTIDAATYGTNSVDTTSTLQAAMNTCPEGQVVYLPAGSYKFNGTVITNKGITIRGAGPTQTILYFNGNAGSLGHIRFTSDAGKSTYTTQRDWTSGYAKGTQTITLDSAAGLSVNQVIWLDELNDTSLVNPNGSEGLNCCSGRTGTNIGNGGNTRALVQINRVTNIAGNTVALEQPLMFDFKEALSPQVIYWSVGGHDNVRKASVEDLTIDGSGVPRDVSDTLLSFEFCTECWAKNLNVRYVPARGVRFYVGYRNVLRDSFIHDARDASSLNYGMDMNYCTSCLVENNIFARSVAGVMVGFPNSGCVIAYNYMAENSPIGTYNYWLFPDPNIHDAHNYMILLEGNEFQQYTADIIHGSASHITLFRNRVLGNGANKTGHRWPVEVQAWNRVHSLIGNVLGDPGFHNTYEIAVPSNGGSGNPVYQIGYWTTSPDGTNQDLITLSTMMRWGNYDTVNGTVRWVSSEVPGSSVLYPNAVPSNQTLASSFYLSAKPAWWGSVAWPPIGPDVTGGNVSGLGGRVNKIPARLCYERGTFDANICYGQSASLPPTAPSNLSVQ